MLVPYTRSTSLNSINNDNNQVPQPAHNPDSPTALALLDTTEKVSDQFERLVQDYESRIRSLEARAQAAEESSAQLSAANVQLTSDLQGKNQQLAETTNMLNWVWEKFFEHGRLHPAPHYFYFRLPEFKRRILESRDQPLLTDVEINQRNIDHDNAMSNCTIC